jgi:ubiquitin-conjugating enzyme E2 J2
MFNWYYLIFGLKDCLYEDGFYMGRIIFPKEYPMKPPGIEMITPNGRFAVNKRICMSMSDYHPETWNPAWHTETIIVGLISFMLSEERTTGCVNSTDEQKRAFAM